MADEGTSGAGEIMRAILRVVPEMVSYLHLPLPAWHYGAVANERWGYRRVLAAVALVVVVGGAGGGLVWLVRVALTEGLQVAAAWAQLGSLVFAVVALGPAAAALVGWWRSVEPVASGPTADQVDHAHRTLAALVLAQWREEILTRQLDDPAPLMVRWRLTELPVMDQHDRVFGVLRPSPLRLLVKGGRRGFAGRSDRVGELAEEFLRLSRRRLVILGGPGMGKTTLAVLLLRELLRRYEPARPVPVLLPLSGWRPRDQSLPDWLARRITEIYPALRAADFGPDVVAMLIAQRRVLPVLDGLDELPRGYVPVCSPR
jgi:NACHT domain-containing protein